MALDAEKVRAAIESKLKESKDLTEREVKAAVARVLKLKPAEVAAGMIRDVRKAMGVGRPAAIEFAQQLVRKNPTAPAREIIEAVAERFGVRIGAPDVSRMRPEKSKKTTGRRARAAAPAPRPAAEPAKAAPAPKAEKAVKAVKEVKEAKAEKAAKGKVGRPAKEAKATASAAPTPLLHVGAAPAAGAPPKGSVRVSFEGTGHPDDLAEFFLSLGRKG